MTLLQSLLYGECAGIPLYRSTFFFKGLGVGIFAGYLVGYLFTLAACRWHWLWWPFSPPAFLTRHRNPPS